MKKYNYALPFIVLALAAFFMGVDTFTDYVITDTMVQLAVTILTPLGLGGLVNKAWNVYKEVRLKALEI